jgi:hypothetical protein
MLAVPLTLARFACFISIILLLASISLLPMLMSTLFSLSRSHILKAHIPYRSRPIDVAHTHCWFLFPTPSNYVGLLPLLV